MQPSRAAVPLTFRGTVNPLQKRDVEPHIDGVFPASGSAAGAGVDRGNPAPEMKAAAL